MKLTLLLEDILLEARIDELKTKYVGNDKLIKNENDFEKIFTILKSEQLSTIFIKKLNDLSNNTEITTRVIEKYLDIFMYIQNTMSKKSDKIKNLLKSVGAEKSQSEVSPYSLEELELIYDKLKKIENSGEATEKPNYINKNGILKLRSVGIEFLGVADGYQVFEVPKDSGKETWDVYSRILGRCSDHKEGGKITICTMAGYESFEENIKKGPFYVLYNYDDPLSPYQIGFEAGQFKDKDNTEYF